MSEVRRVTVPGRVVLAGGAVALLLSLYFPWVGMSGNQPNLPTTSFGGADLVNMFSVITGLAFAWPIYLWLFVVVAGAIVAAAFGRRLRNLGASAVLAIALLGGMAFLLSFLANYKNASATSSVIADWGLVLALGGAILIEVGMRLTKPLRAAQPAAAPAPAAVPVAASAPTTPAEPPK